MTAIEFYGGRALEDTNLLHALYSALQLHRSADRKGFLRSAHDNRGSLISLDGA